jgi:transcription elongation GreA/GreB family factor
MAGVHGMETSAARGVDLRERVADALERLSQALVTQAAGVMRAGPSPTTSRLQETVRFLGQVMAAWDDVPGDAFRTSGAGFGSVVTVEDLDQGQCDVFTLMAGPLIDFDSGHVSLASPVGQALLGRRIGEVVHAMTPQRLRRLRIVAVRTLEDHLPEPPLPAA